MKRISHKIRQFTHLLACAAIAAMVCGTSPAVAAETIRIGWLPALTGALASSAIAENYGAKVAVAEINAAGGVHGRMLELITRDTGSDPAKAVSFAKELMYNEKVHFILGPANSGEAMPVAPATAAAKMPTVVLGALNELIDLKKYPYAFRAIVTNDQWIDVASEFIVKDLGKKKIAMLFDTSGYCELSRKSFLATLKGYGIKPAYVSMIDPNRPDVTDEIIKARKSGADVLIAWSASAGFLARILNARGEQGWDVPTVGQPTLGFGGVGELLAKPAYWENVYHTGFGNSTRLANGDPPPLTGKLIEENKDTIYEFVPYGLPVLTLGYSSVYLIREAVEKAGGSTRPDDIKAAFEQIRDMPLPYATFSYGPDSHDGFPLNGIVMNVSNSIDREGMYRKAEVPAQ